MSRRSEPSPEVRAGRAPGRSGPQPLALHLANARHAWGGLDDRRFRRFVAGLQAYWRHPFRRPPSAPSVLWSAGAARLLAFGEPSGYPVLVVPSLVNRADILDLLPGRSVIGFLAARGFRPLLLDWGEPGPGERRMTLAEHTLGRLGDALDVVRTCDRRRPAVLGYCMGGLLALALAVHRRRQLAGLALLATPWDFAAHGLDRERFARTVVDPASALAGRLGALPVAWLQALFASLDPLQVPRKFARFAELGSHSREAKTFVAVEDWLNDGVPLGAEVARECLAGWYVANQPGEGCWRVGGRTVRPDALDLPALLAIPARDRIVPPASAEGLARVMRRPVVLRPGGGHVGMVVGARAKRELFEPLAGWLGRIAAMQD